MGCFGDNVRAFRVDGSFDDCQRLVKSVLSDPGFRAEVPLGSANSISLGRLLPQMTYYAHAALNHWRAHATPLNFVVPTGNLGNALACLLARRIGLPIGRIVLASNANAVLPDFFAGGDYAPGPSIATLANAMDVGAPNNFERLQWLYPDAAELRTVLSAEAVDDATIRTTIVDAWERHGEAICPHTACAVHVLQRLREAGATGDWAAVSTAHPAKFPDAMEAITGARPDLPKRLAALMIDPERFEVLANDLGTVQRYVEQVSRAAGKA